MPTPERVLNQSPKLAIKCEEITTARNTMKHSIYRALLAAFAAFSITACDNASSDVTGSNPVTGDANGFRISGHLYTTGSQVSGSTRVCVEGVCVLPDASGAFTVTGTAKAAAGRVMSSDTITHAYIVIGNDTLREIPVVSWSEILPANYVVQRNVSVIPNAEYRKSTMQAVYFSTDSIAKVVTLAPTNMGKTFTGYIYSVYDSAAYANNTTIYSWFARVKRNDSTLAYTSVMPVTGLSGDLVADSVGANGGKSFIAYTKYYHHGYSLVPNDSSISSYTEFTRMDTLIEVTEYMQSHGMYFIFNNTDSAVNNHVYNSVDSFAVFPDTLRFTPYSNLLSVNNAQGVSRIPAPAGCDYFTLVFTDSANVKRQESTRESDGSFQLTAFALPQGNTLTYAPNIHLTYATNIHLYAHLKH